MFGLGLMTDFGLLPFFAVLVYRLGVSHLVSTGCVAAKTVCRPLARRKSKAESTVAHVTELCRDDCFLEYNTIKESFFANLREL